MLKILRQIIQEIDTTQDLEQALYAVVQQVKKAIDADACSVFLIDPQTNEYVLLATDGLNPSLVGQVRLQLGEGLIGLIGEREEPINLDVAPDHPSFRSYPGLNEESFSAFLGVPIIHQREVFGVLAVQQQISRFFDEAEEAFLVTLAAQLGGVVAHAQATGAVMELMCNYRGESVLLKETTLTGIPSAAGVALGTGIVVYPLADLDAVPERFVEDIEAEIERFTAALQVTRSEIARLAENLKVTLPLEEQSLFDAYARILESPSLCNAIIEEIRQGYWAQSALKHVIYQQVKKFEAMDDVYFRERATDLRDLGQRILAHLQEGERDKRIYPEKTILVGEEVTPTDLAEVPEGQLAGVVSVKGSSNSHVAILARALGVPTIMGISVGVRLGLLEGQTIIVDGYYGQVYLNPSETVRNEFLNLAREEEEIDNNLESLRNLPAETTDGYGVSLYVNTGLAADIGRSLSVGAEGVGLYRTEVPFMVRERFPTEEEQRIIYRQLLTAFAPRPVMMRTLDVGGDKALPYFPIDDENPFLGWRGIRITLDHPEIFLAQVRAMLRASIGLDNIHILLPMVSGVAEVEEAMRLLVQAHVELLEEGESVKMPTLGVMLEVPSSLYLAREIAQRVDFVSVGSNDLTQYLLAVDRNNARVAGLYDSLHPAVLRSLSQVVKNVHKERKHIGICGEMAADPLAVILLLAMGFDSLSMSAMRLPRVKWVIRQFSMEQAKELLEEVLVMDDPAEIRCHMELALEKAGLGGLIRAGQ
jgi:phosphotransferase system enzyme I (PtsP)